MKKIINMLLSFSAKDLLNLISTALAAIKEFFCYKSNKLKEKEVEENNKQKKNFDKRVDEVVDKGTLEDLLDLRK